MNRTVLLIEDNVQNRYLLTFLLEQHGYSVISVDNGEQAISMVATLSPDLILLDIQLPRMDGYAVARALRGLGTIDAVPIIAVTSYAMVGDREKSLAAGCNGYIEKPINPDTFVSQLAAFHMDEAPASDCKTRGDP